MQHKKFIHPPNQTIILKSHCFNSFMYDHPSKKIPHKKIRKKNIPPETPTKQKMTMINNLFSIFDPSTYTRKLGWAPFLALLILFINKTKVENSISTLKMSWFITPQKETTQLMVNPKKEEISGVTSLFLIILIINFSSLYCFSFTLSAQPRVVAAIALMCWLSVYKKGWLKNTGRILVHMVPKGTPTPLINFMVIIEMTRNIIRPLTLSIRLVANITAGHILLLLARRITSSKEIAFISPFIVLIISFLEGAVSYIQAYVFSSLIALYLRETKYEKI